MCSQVERPPAEAGGPLLQSSERSTRMQEGFRPAAPAEASGRHIFPLPAPCSLLHAGPAALAAERRLLACMDAIPMGLEMR